METLGEIQIIFIFIFIFIWYVMYSIYFLGIRVSGFCRGDPPIRPTKIVEILVLRPHTKASFVWETVQPIVGRRLMPAHRNASIDQSRVFQLFFRIVPARPFNRKCPSLRPKKVTSRYRKQLFRLKRQAQRLKNMRLASVFRCGGIRAMIGWNVSHTNCLYQAADCMGTRGISQVLRIKG